MTVIEEQFWAKVDKTATCWIWIGGRVPQGYGMFNNKRAHRVSWEMANGPIPKGLWILHKCDNPPCVRPDHLWPGTAKDNAQDREQKGRSSPQKGNEHWSRRNPEWCARGNRHSSKTHPERVPRGIRHGSYTHPESRTIGERNGCSKLTTDKVLIIMKRISSGENLSAIGREFNVSSTAIDDIKARRTWKHLSWPD